MRKVWPTAIAAGAAALLVYLATLAPGLSWLHNGADGGDLAAAAATAGIPHPPGYPTYMLLSLAFARLPAGDIALRLNIMSALCAAVAVALLCIAATRVGATTVRYSELAICPPQRHGEEPQAPRLSLRLGGERDRSWRKDGSRIGSGAGSMSSLAGAGAALMFAFSPLFWSQAVIAEVYALNALFVAVLIVLGLWAGRPPGLLSLVFGLGLGNHLSLLLLAPSLVLLAAANPLAEARRPGLWLRRLLAFSAGLLVYLYLPLRATADPLINWGDPQTLDRFLWMVSGAPYRHYLFAVSPSELLPRLTAWAQLLVQQFGWAGSALALLGLWDMLTARPESWPSPGAPHDRRRAGALALVLALYSAYGLGYATSDSYVYLIPAYVIVVLWLARGLQLLLAGVRLWSAEERRDALPWTRAALPFAVILLILLPARQLQANWAVSDARADRRAINFIDAVCNHVSPGALIITASDEQTFALWYGLASGRCRDVAVIDRDLTQFDWYRRQAAGRAGLTIDQRIDEPALYVQAIIETTGARRPIYLAMPDAELAQRYSWVQEGALYRLAAPSP